MNQEEREWKKWPESEGCSSELVILKHWETGICNTWESRSHQRARAKPFGSKRPDQPPSVRFPRYREGIAVQPFSPSVFRVGLWEVQQCNHLRGTNEAFNLCG